jgi:glycosyltransferase involved in cell wall biosynthesis
MPARSGMRSARTPPPNVRILQVHTRYREAGGEDSVVSNEAALLRSAGHDVETYVEENPEARAESVLTLVSSPWNANATRRVVRAAEAFQPDVVHIHNTWFRMSPAVVRGLHDSGFPTVITMHNYRLACLNAQLYRDGEPCEDCVGRIPWRGVTRRCYRDSAIQSAMVGTTVMVHRAAGTWDSHADVVIALTDFAAERLVASGVPRERIMVKGNFVDDPGHRSSPPSNSDYTLFLGRLADEKGIADLIRAWEDGPLEGIELLIAGDGPLRSQIESALPPGARLLGRRPIGEVRDLLLGARALVFPSRWYEGLPMVLVEALSAGTPVVYPELGAIPQVVHGGGWGFEALDVDSLGKAMQVLAHDGEVDARGLVARRQFEEHFTPTSGLRALENVYARALARAPRSPA